MATIPATVSTTPATSSAALHEPRKASVATSADNKKSPIRALHVYAALNRGGAETWLMDVIRNTSRNDLAIDVCLTGEARGAYEEEFMAKGGRVHRCPLRRNAWRFAGQFQELLKGEGYDVVHSHLYYFSGVVLRVAARAGVPQRVAHNHPVEDAKASGVVRGLYKAWMRRWMCRYGTHFVGPTRASMASFWGPEWERDSNKHVLYNGVDVKRFERSVDRGTVRDELRIPRDAKIVLNVARFVAHKRQAFLAEVAAILCGRRADTYFVLIGDGPTHDEVERRVEAAGLVSRFRFIRGLPNIDDCWLSADVFAFPSVNEGFGIVIAEAAAAGLPVVACDILGVGEAAAACERPTLLPLNASPQDWANAIDDALLRPAYDATQRASMLRRFPFTIEASIEALKKLYGIAFAKLEGAGGS